MFGAFNFVPNYRQIPTPTQLYSSLKYMPIKVFKLIFVTPFISVVKMAIHNGSHEILPNNPAF